MTDHNAGANLPAFYPANAPVPESLTTPEFHLRMLQTSDVDLDYAAVIASREHLLVRSAGSWPSDDFTLEEDLADLAEHQAEHQARVAFTYTIMSPTEIECLGCVYINSLARMLQLMEASADDLASVGDYEAVVSFWMTPSCRAADTDARLLAALREWFRHEWAFHRVGFIANKNERRQMQLYAAAGLRSHFTIERPQEPYRFYIYT
jgi:hypothetical protein